jgi:hypothetical protein
MTPPQSERIEWLNMETEEFSDEQLLDHMQSNPLGRLLRLIASLPEVRRDKVLRARREIRENPSDIDSRLDLALDRVLEELIMEE